MWNRWPYWLRGGIVAILYLVVLVPLSSFCPEDINCFTSLFVEPLFYPFLAIDSLFPELGMFLGESVLAFLLIFWFVLGSILGAGLGLWVKILKNRTPKKAKEENLDFEEDDEDEVPKPETGISELPDPKVLEERR